MHKRFKIKEFDLELQIDLLNNGVTSISATRFFEAKLYFVLNRMLQIEMANELDMELKNIISSKK